MAEGAVVIKNIASVTANVRICTNILGFKEDHVMNINPRFIPNLYQGVDVLQRAKWRELTITLDSEHNIFDANFFVAAINVAVGTTIVAVFDLADGASGTEDWTYEISKAWVSRKEFGRIEDGATRNTTEYTIICYGTKLIT